MWLGAVDGGQEVVMEFLVPTQMSRACSIDKSARGISDSKVHCSTTSQTKPKYTICCATDSVVVVKQKEAPMRLTSSRNSSSRERNLFESRSLDWMSSTHCAKNPPAKGISHSSPVKPSGQTHPNCPMPFTTHNPPFLKVDKRSEKTQSSMYVDFDI